jgi:uncharacterized membrane protein
MTPTAKKPGPAYQNIETIARMEQQFLEQRTFVDRVGDAIAGFAGSMPFVILHLCWFAVWIIINSGAVPIHPFDPYPYIFLSMIVSMEAVLLSTFVLMKQNRMSKRADHRSQLDLQINLLSEKELTKILQMLQDICAHMGLEEKAGDAEIQELSQDTVVEELAQNLKKTLPDC